MSEGSRRVRLGVTRLPAIPPWDAMLAVDVDAPIEVSRGDGIRVRMEWIGSEGGIMVWLELVRVRRPGEPQGPDER